MTEHEVVSHDEWIEARKAFLAREKAFASARAAMARDLRDLPWEEVTGEYSFDGPEGTATLAALFGDRGQLIVYHFMFAPGWDAGCPHCSFWADTFNGVLAHLRARDTAFAAVSRAPYSALASYQHRMGWTFPWYSAAGTDFNYDLGASFTAAQIGTPAYNYGTDPGGEDREGISAFVRQDGRIFHTYSTYARGIDPANGAYTLLDMTAKGRDELAGDPQSWVRRRDEY